MASLTATGLSSKVARFSSNLSLKSPNRFPQSLPIIQRRAIATASVKASTDSNFVSSSSSPQQLELNVGNVDLVLEEVRPYLISDGGNVDVVSVEDGVVSLQLQGACESCPSSTTTMKMGIERALKEKFGDSLKDVRQVFDDQPNETTVQAVNGHLDILRPAIKNFGGSVEVLAVRGSDCFVKYSGPDSIASGIKAAIKEKFPDITNVFFDDY